MKSPFLFAVVALVLLSMTLPAQGQVSRTTTENVIDVYFTQAEYPCLTETVHVLGTYRSTFTFNIGPNNTFLYSVANTKFKTSAIGETTGSVYQFNGPFHTTVVGSLDYLAPVEWTYRDINHLVGPGGNQNFYVHTLFHFTYDPATEVVKATFDHSTLQCK